MEDLLVKIVEILSWAALGTAILALILKKDDET